MSDEPLRVGLVGTGYWAREVHAVGVATHPETELVAVWGRDPDKTADLAARHGATACDDVDAMLGQVDAVVFAVPPDVQAEVAVRAAAAGKHLLLEKPVATSLADADRVAAAVGRAGVASVVFFTERFVSERESWLERLADLGCLGGQATWLASLRTPDNPFATSPWRQDRGALWDVGPHALSVLLPVLGPVVDVAGARGVDDLVHLVLTHEGGATSTVSLSLTMPPEATASDLRFYDTGGWHVRPDVSSEIVPTQQRALSELVATARAGRTAHRCDVRFGRDVVAVLERAERVLAG